MPKSNAELARRHRAIVALKLEFFDNCETRLKQALIECQTQKMPEWWLDEYVATEYVATLKRIELARHAARHTDNRFGARRAK
jgi:hypothetical protein